MSRSGYTDDYGDEYPGQMDLYRHAVERAIEGKRGQAFLREMGAALDAMAHKRLIADELVDDVGEVCAIGAVGVRRRMDLSRLEQDAPWDVGDAFGIARSMAAEIAFENDEAGPMSETPEQRWTRMREWVRRNLKAKPEGL